MQIITKTEENQLNELLKKFGAKTLQGMGHDELRAAADELDTSWKTIDKNHEDKLAELREALHRYDNLRRSIEAAKLIIYQIDNQRYFEDIYTGYKFEWWFDDLDLKKAESSKVEDDIFGSIEVTTPCGNKYIVDIHKEYFNAKEYGYDLEVYKMTEHYGHGDWLESLRGIKTAKTLKGFRTRAQRLIETYIYSYEHK